MALWRVLTVLVLTLILGLPLVWTVAALDPCAPLPVTWGQLALARNSILLIAGTILVALPLGTVLAFFLERTDLPGRSWWLGCFLVPLFVPLPLFAAGWQAALGSGGLMTLSPWGGADGWVPWAQGLIPAIWIHAVAGVPWVVLIVGHGLRRIEPELEEEALLEGGIAWCVRRVTLPRTLPSVTAAVLWLGLTVWTEISITDIVQVRTFAEEVYTQLVGPELSAHDPLAAAVMISLPGTAGAVFLLLALVWWWDRHEISLPGSLRSAVVFDLGRWRVPVQLLLVAIALLLLGVPLAGLLWRAGVQGQNTWSAVVLVSQVVKSSQLQGRHLLANIGVALLAGATTSVLALATSWLGRESRVYRWPIVVVAALACAMPGPLLGLGMKSLILAALQVFPSEHLEWALWQGPSYLPLLWVNCIRFFPVALAITWPMVRSWPREWFEAARLDGVGIRDEWRILVWPQGRRAWGRASVAVMILGLGELSAGKLVSTPGAAGYAEMIFAQLHYGLTPDLAGQCLLLVGVVAIAGAGLLVARSSRDSRWE